jgi:uncharacterized protein
MAGAALTIAGPLAAAAKKSILVFTKSSGWEHDVVKRVNGELSIVEKVLKGIGDKYGYDVTCTKDGRIFDSKEFPHYDSMFFYTTGDLTELGTDKQPPMTEKGKQTLLDAIHGGKGFAGTHAASDTFHTKPDPPDLSNRYIAHGDKEDPYLRMLGGEFIKHNSDPRLQTTNIIIDDPGFPGLEGVHSPVSFNEEWYSIKDFVPDIHVIATVDTKGMQGNCYKRPPYPVVWARMHGKGRVFYAAMGDKPENWQNEFFLNLVTGGVRWATGDASAKLTHNLKTAAPGYAVIPPQDPPKPKA